MEASLREPGVEGRTEALQRRGDPSGHRIRARPCEPIQVLRPQALILEVVRELGDVVPGVAVLGHRLATHVRRDRRGKAIHLAAGVVQQVLAADLVSARLEQASHRVPVRGTAAAGDRERPRGIRRHVLDEDSLGARRRGSAVGLTAVEDGRDRLPVPAVGQVYVQKARPCHLHLTRGITQPLPHVGCQPLGDVAGLLPENRREQHGRVRRVITHLRLRRPLERRPFAGTIGQGAGGGIDRCAELCKGVGHGRRV